jgi:hypothetical protein
MRILLLDARLDLDADSYAFKSGVSLYDYDVVFWEPAQSLKAYIFSAPTWRGKTSLYEASSAELIQDIKRRRTEFKEFVEMGRCLVVFLPGETEVWVDTGKREYSGTGRNRASTKLVDTADIMKSIPLDLVRTVGAGIEIEAADEVASSLLRETRGQWVYRCLIEDHKMLRPLFRVRGTKKNVGATLRTSANRGAIVLLPELYLDDENDDYYEEPADSDEHAGTDEPVDAAVPNETKEPDEPNPSEALLAWVQNLISAPDAELPEWAGSFRFAEEVERGESLRLVENQIGALQQQVDELKADQARDDQWKALMVASGGSLERQVQRAFEVLGFEADDTTPGRSDLRMRLGEQRVVVEVKGLSKSAAEKHAAQLEKWVSEEVAAGSSAKGILVVNTWRGTSPKRRTEADFPDQMIPYATQRSHCLVTGLQLLAMARAALADPTTAPAAAQSLIDTVGPMAGWTDLDELFPLEPENAVSNTTGSDLTSEDETVAAVDNTDAPETTDP